MPGLREGVELKHVGAIRAAVAAFIELFEAGCGSEEPCPAALIAALECLAARAREVPSTCVPGELDPPGKDYTQVRAEAAKRFPGLGFYRLETLSGDFVGDALVQQGISNALVLMTSLPTYFAARRASKPDGYLCREVLDDITDVALELYGVLWLWENDGPDAALWHFENGYCTHRGSHLRDLLNHLQSG